MHMENLNRLRLMACEIRMETMKIIASKGNGHVGGSLSIADVLAVLYGEVMKYDLIVSNPPYVCESERAQMERHVLDYEPGLALFVPDDDPLLFYRAIINYASTALMDGGMLAFETNREYATEVGMLMKEGGWSNVEVKRDMFNNERIVIGCLSRKL